MWIEWLNNIKNGAISFWESIDVSKVVDLFVYDGQNPLMFNTGLFLFLFVGFIWIYRLLARRDTLRIYFVILFSLYFYYKSSGLCFLLLLFVALSDYSLEAFRLGFVEMDASIFRFDEHGGQFGDALLFQIHELVTGYDCRFHP